MGRDEARAGGGRQLLLATAVAHVEGGCGGGRSEASTVCHSGVAVLSVAAAAAVVAAVAVATGPAVAGAIANAVLLLLFCLLLLLLRDTWCFADSLASCRPYCIWCRS